MWTDYPSLESYALDAETLDMANAASFNTKLPPASDLMAPLCFALSELFAVRVVHPNLQKPKYETAFKKQRTLSDFDVARVVPAEISDRVKSYPRPDSGDVRSYAYGHDIAGLLLAAYANTFKNQIGLTGVEAIEGVLRMAVLAVGSYRAESLFLSLRGWVDPQLPRSQDRAFVTEEG